VAKAGEQLNVDAYIRVSRVKRRPVSRFHSPTIQREQMESWAQATGADVLSYFEELDESGGRRDRPKLEAAIRRVEEHVTQGLIVWKVDRFFRRALEGQLAIRRIMSAGGTLFSVLDGLDSRTDTGRHMLRIALSDAEFEMDRIRDGWERAHAKAVARGAYCAPTPVGYRRTRSGRLRPDPATSPVIAELFARRADGVSIPKLTAWLTEQGVSTSFGNVGWQSSSVCHLLYNRVYLGEVHWGPYHRDNAHPALTDPATWERAHRPRQQLYRVAREPALLAGLVRCANCCTICTAQRGRARGDERRLYACRGVSAAGKCPRAASMREAALDACVTEAVFELLRKRRRPAVERLRAAEDTVAGAQADLAAYRDSRRLQAVLDEATFLAGLRVRSHAVVEARLALATERSRHALHDLPRARELQRDWPTMELAARRAVIGRVIDCVFIAPGRHDPPERRITICPAGTAPAHLPFAGSRKALARPFSGPLKRPRPRPRPPSRPPEDARNRR
jgi:DNA invertase Pin-like site-specific DNA recombinase